MRRIGSYRIVSLGVVALTTLVALGCRRQQHPTLIDTLGEPIANGTLDQGLNVYAPPADPRDAVPIIVVAVVERNTVVAKHLQAARYAHVYLDLHMVECKRENTIKGGLTGQELRFFYFADGRYPDGDANPLYKQLFDATPGSRYLLFLKRDGDTLRSIGDVGPYSILIAAGHHREQPMEFDEIGERIADILLTPGDGANLDLLSKILGRSSAAADFWSSRPHTVKLLRQLFPLGEPLHSQACGVLVESYSGQEDCLQTIADDPNESAANREEASKELKEKSEDRKRFLQDLKDPAALDYQRRAAGDSWHRIREELETLLFNPDPLQHERACTALKRYFPRTTEPKCAP
jgi:hypothetical protein